ncbi:hypothetical protein [Pseudonocardia sp. GCM10023141]|uniref:hypothetical protein n=1 Tax=Pseudonocardia sp. GCM10023141 TaxID=3252653 RepID=UPI0036144862
MKRTLVILAMAMGVVVSGATPAIAGTTGSTVAQIQAPGEWRRHSGGYKIKTDCQWFGANYKEIYGWTAILCLAEGSTWALHYYVGV